MHGARTASDTTARTRPNARDETQDAIISRTGESRSQQRRGWHKRGTNQPERSSAIFRHSQPRKALAGAKLELAILRSTESTIAPARCGREQVQGAAFNRPYIAVTLLDNAARRLVSQPAERSRHCEAKCRRLDFLGDHGRVPALWPAGASSHPPAPRQLLPGRTGSERGRRRCPSPASSSCARRSPPRGWRLPSSPRRASLAELRPQLAAASGPRPCLPT